MLTLGLPDALENELDECLLIITDASAAFLIFAGKINSDWDGAFVDFVNVACSPTFLSACVSVKYIEVLLDLGETFDMPDVEVRNLKTALRTNFFSNLKFTLHFL